MGRAQMEIRVGRAGNGTPVFLVHGQNQTFGRVFGATWDSDRALWMYPAFYPASGKVLADLQAVASDVNVVISDVAQRHIEALEEVHRRLEAQTLPAGFEYVTSPYLHQVEGLCHVFYNMRAALFYDPGLGKSKIAIDLIRLLRHTGNAATALVLGPRVTVRNWGRQIDLHSGRQVTWAALVGTPKQKRAILDRAVGAQRGQLDSRPGVALRAPVADHVRGRERRRLLVQERSPADLPVHARRVAL